MKQSGQHTSICAQMEASGVIPPLVPRETLRVPVSGPPLRYSKTITVAALWLCRPARRWTSAE